MNNSIGSRHRRSKRTSAARRAQLLAVFDRSGWTAAAFARQHGINYTIPPWRDWQRRDAASPSPGFVQVELPPPTPPVELVLELGSARLCLHSASQMALAARLLQAFHSTAPC